MSLTCRIFGARDLRHYRHGRVGAFVMREPLSVAHTTMAILPWLVPLMLALVAITYIPAITLWLPRAMGMLK